MQDVLSMLSGWIWGKPLLALILGTGLWLMVSLRFMPILQIAYGFKQLYVGRKGLGKGDISPFAALMTSLSATIGTGNITGVATAITLGGPGALFWMWCSALLGMATKYAEAVCAVEYRETDPNGRHVGGPMYYIKNGLGQQWRWLAMLFAVFGALAGFGIGNGVQANSIAHALQSSFNIDSAVTAIVLIILVAMVLLGGVKRIGNVASKLVPLMAGMYLLTGGCVLLVHAAEIPAALLLIFKSAFTPLSAAGGAAGFAVSQAIQYGVARGVFSNEAGLGSAPIAHAAAETDSPVRQGSVAMLGTFIDTLIICSITGLCIIVTGVWQGPAQGVELSQQAFQSVFSFGDIIIALSLTIFAFTTILGWSYYSERCAQFVLGEKAVIPFRIVWVIMVGVGATSNITIIWTFADVLNGLMAIPNLIALLLLSGVVVRLTRQYFTKNTD